MARGRLISKTLGTSSKRFVRLASELGRLGEFGQALYPLIVANTDDFGRMDGDSFTVKHSVWPTSPRGDADFERALAAMATVGLLQRYEVGGKVYLQIADFDTHQPGLHRRTQSSIPPPPDGTPVLDASEADMECHICGKLERGLFQLDDLTVKSWARQVRVGNSYLDILVQTHQGPQIVIEVKRQRVTESAIAQVMAYAKQLHGDVVPVVVGNGLAGGLQVDDREAVIVTYDDSQVFRQVGVHARSFTFTQLPPEEKRSEQKVKEPKEKADKSAVFDGFSEFWLAYPRKDGKQEAQKAWASLAPVESVRAAILADVQRRIRSEPWLKDGGKFIPHGSTYLRGKRWEDAGVQWNVSVESDNGQCPRCGNQGGRCPDVKVCNRRWLDNQKSQLAPAETA